MSRLLGAVNAAIQPDRGMIFVAGPAAEFVPLERPVGDRIVQTAPDLIYLFSASDRPHVADVTLEAWDGLPPHGGHWEAVQRTTVDLSDGTIHVSRSLERPASPILTVGPPGVYQVLALVTGRTELRRLDEDQNRPEEPRVERFVLRFGHAGRRI